MGVKSSEASQKSTSGGSSKYIEDINDEAMDAWINALRSGDYQQTRSCLADSKGMCCLGVQASLLGGKPSVHVDYGMRFEGDGCTYEFLPPVYVIEALNLPEEYVHRNGTVASVLVDATQTEQDNRLTEYGDDTKISVTVFNDGLRMDFNEIADRLEDTFLRKDKHNG